MRYRMAARMRPNRMNHARGGNSMRKYLFLHCVAAFLSVGVLAAPALSQMGGQDKSKRPSPPAKAECKLAGGKSITVDYSSPRMKGRKIYGGVVPFGEGWWAGVEEGAPFVTTTDPTRGGMPVPCGIARAIQSCQRIAMSVR